MEEMDVAVRKARDQLKLPSTRSLRQASQDDVCVLTYVEQHSHKGSRGVDEAGSLAKALGLAG